jgi:hypothetical protein
MEEKRRENALRYYYTQRYGDKADEKMKQNKAKKEGKVYQQPLGRPKTSSDEDLTKKHGHMSLMYYYRKRYGDHADQIYQLQMLKKTVSLSKKAAKSKEPKEPKEPKKKKGSKEQKEPTD